MRWDDSKMISNFANVVTIQSTPEQVDLFFGTNQMWNMSDEKQLTVELNSRIILTPHTAMAEITSPDFEGERLIVCRSPALAAERRRQREDLLSATEKDLARIQATVARRRTPLNGKDAIALKAGAVLGRRKVAKHFTLTITDTAFSFAKPNFRGVWDASS